MKSSAKKTISIILLVCFIFTMVSNMVQAEVSPDLKFVFGDVSGDAKVMANDYALVRDYVLGRTSSFTSPYGLTVGDVSGDGKIMANDYALIRDFVLKRISTFPAQKTWVLKKGSDDFTNDIIVLQKLLVVSGYLKMPIDPNTCKYKPFGTYADLTEAAVRSFQGVKNLPVTGEVDKDTWAKLELPWNDASGQPDRFNTVYEGIMKNDINPKGQIFPISITSAGVTWSYRFPVAGNPNNKINIFTIGSTGPQTVYIAELKNGSGTIYTAATVSTTYYADLSWNGGKLTASAFTPSGTKSNQGVGTIGEAYDGHTINNGIDPITLDAINDARGLLDEMCNQYVDAYPEDYRIGDYSWGKSYEEKLQTEINKLSGYAEIFDTIDLCNDIASEYSKFQGHVPDPYCAAVGAAISVAWQKVYDKEPGIGELPEALGINGWLTKGIAEAKEKSDFINNTNYKYLIYMDGFLWERGPRVEFIERVKSLKSAMMYAEETRYSKVEDNAKFKSAQLNYLDLIIKMNENYDQSKSDMEEMIEVLCD